LLHFLDIVEEGFLGFPFFEELILEFSLLFRNVVDVVILGLLELALA